MSFQKSISMDLDDWSIFEKLFIIPKSKYSSEVHSLLDSWDQAILIHLKKNKHHLSSKGN